MFYQRGTREKEKRNGETETNFDPIPLPTPPGPPTAPNCVSLCVINTLLLSSVVIVEEEGKRTGREAFSNRST